MIMNFKEKLHAKCFANILFISLNKNKIKKYLIIFYVSPDILLTFYLVFSLFPGFITELWN